ncbi:MULTISPECIES: mycofactocin-coupled SDR family oxidoreductase [unclassified Streptomyces]|uniref:mycofactocin-coupled SDR family oxidoreductase n=1 Tax=unclassified Streptomyces TaxID=2593676 RepID=UPI003443FFAA
MGRLSGKVAVITGAGRGQGRSHAVRLAEEGADIIAIDLCEDIPVVEYPLASAEDLRETVRLVEKTGRRVVAHQADVRDRAALRAAVDAGAAELGRLDIVVPNAGILPIGAGRPITAWAETVDINLSGVINTVHAALPHLGEGASVVVIGSIVGLQPGHSDVSQAGPGFAAYRFAKHSLVEYVNTLSQLVAAQHIRVNAVHPTNVDTRMLLNDAVYQAFLPDKESPTLQDAMPIFTGIQAMPIPYVTPEDVSHAVVYLASDEARYVTGLHLKIDGGAQVKLGL